MLIQPKFLSLSDLLTNRFFRIPQYQRSYSWESKHRRDMFVHRLGNLMLLPPGMNSKLNDNKPSEKIGAYRSTGLFTANEVADTIEKDGWLVAQIDERKRKILDGVKVNWA